MKESHFAKVDHLMRDRRELMRQLDGLKKAGVMQAKYIVNGVDVADFDKAQLEALRDAAITLVSKQIDVFNDTLKSLGVRVGE